MICGTFLIVVLLKMVKPCLVFKVSYLWLLSLPYSFILKRHISSMKQNLFLIISSYQSFLHSVDSTITNSENVLSQGNEICKIYKDSNFNIFELKKFLILEKNFSTLATLCVLFWDIMHLRDIFQD